MYKYKVNIIYLLLSIKTVGCINLLHYFVKPVNFQEQQERERILLYLKCDLPETSIYEGFKSNWCTLYFQLFCPKSGSTVE